MWKLYTYGIACPILWTLAILELVSGINYINDYRSVKLKSQKVGAIRSFVFSVVLFALAVVTTVLLIDAVKALQ